MAIAFHKQIDDDTSFAVWKIEEQADQLYQQLQLNEREKAYIESLSKGKRSLHWLGTRVLLRTMLNTNQYIDCQVDQHGKPYLVNMPYQISLTHSFDYAAVMISKSKHVGIDIELIDPKVERIAKRFLNPAELSSIGTQNRIEKLYVCWSAKEAAYKCYGRKQVSFLNHIAIQPFEYPGTGSTFVQMKNNEVDLEFEVNYLAFNGYMIGYTSTIL